jgi:hypothetical protein
MSAIPLSRSRVSVTIGELETVTSRPSGLTATLVPVPNARPSAHSNPKSRSAPLARQSPAVRAPELSRLKIPNKP